MQFRRRRIVGLVRTLGKRVCRKAPKVRILSPPHQIGRFVCLPLAGRAQLQYCGAESVSEKTSQIRSVK